jgi:hypothetical protein
MTGLAVTPTEALFYAALNAFVQQVTGLAAAQCIQGLGNRASMPAPGFIVFEIVTRRRLRTNIDTPDEIDDDPTTATIEEGVELGVQINCFGPEDPTATVGSLDWANMLCATLRDEYGCNFFEGQMGEGVCDPLYADDAKLLPLVDGEEQFEEGWYIDAHFQLNPVTTIPRQYADELTLDMINVQASYPA